MKERERVRESKRERVSERERESENVKEIRVLREKYFLLSLIVENGERINGMV